MFRILGSGFTVEDLRFGSWGLGFRIWAEWFGF